MKRVTLAAFAVLLAVGLVGCTSAADAAEEKAAKELHVREQMWEADGHDGPLPDISGAAVATNVSDLYDSTDDIFMHGSTDAACDSLGASWDLLSQTDMPDEEQQGYLDVILDDLSQAYSACGDGRWKDAMPRIININLMTEQYMLRY